MLPDACSAIRPARRPPNPTGSGFREAARCRRTWRRRCRRKRRTIFAIDGRADLGQRGAGVVHLHRVTRDVYTDASTHAVKIPAGASVGLAAGDEAVRVVGVARALATAEAGHVAQNLRMAGRELVDGFYDRPRARERKRRVGQRGEPTPVAFSRRSRRLFRCRRRDGRWRCCRRRF